MGIVDRLRRLLAGFIAGALARRLEEEIDGIYRRLSEISAEIQSLRAEIASLRHGRGRRCGRIDEIEERLRRLENMVRPTAVPRPSAPVRPIQTTLYIEAEPGRVRQLFGASRAVVDGVVVVEEPSGIIKLVYRPSSAARARELARKIGGRVREVQVVLSVRKRLPPPVGNLGPRVGDDRGHLDRVDEDGGGAGRGDLLH